MRKTVLMVSAVMAALMLAVTGPASERALSPKSAEAASAVKVIVGCYSNPETTRVVNNTNHSITVSKVGSIYQPRSNEPFRVNRTLRAGRAIIFESGYDADRNVLTRQYIYNNDVGAKEGARVTTASGARFADRCG